MSDNILTKSTDLGIGNVTVGNLVEMMRGTPPPTWEQTCLDLDKKLADSRQYVTELENRLRALWDKYDGDRKHYMDRIKRLEEAGDAIDPMNDSECECDSGYVVVCKHCFDRSENWRKAKEAKL